MHIYTFRTFVPMVCGGIALALIAGCGGGSDNPPTVSATGTVTFKGQPVAGATVAFIGEGKPALAITEDDGSFELTTFEQGDGAMEGSYQVTVVKMQAAAAGAGGDDSMESAAAAGKGAAEAESTLPKRYADPQTSGLQCTVKKGQENEFPLELSP